MAQTTETIPRPNDEQEKCDHKLGYIPEEINDKDKR